MNIIEELNNTEQFSNSEAILASYILENKNKILSMSVQELAKETYTSTSSIVRLCRKIGLRGFADFKIEFAAQLQKHWTESNQINVNFPFDKNDSFHEITKTLYQLSVDALNETYQKMQYKDYEKAAQLIKRAKKIAAFGAGDCYTKAVEFQGRMIKINCMVHTSHLMNEDHSLATAFTQEDCALVLSYSGENRFTYGVVELLKRNKVPIIAITGDVNSPIAKRSDVILELPNRGNESYRIAPFGSYIGMEFILYNLYAYYFVLDFDENVKLRLDAETIYSKNRKSNNKK
jgi:DNA-binding MurR/RpiR family transcriptional regulator